MKHLFLYLLLSISITGMSQDSVKAFESPIIIRIPNDTLGKIAYGRTATAANMLINWETKQIVVQWKVRYFDLQDSTINLDDIITPYTRQQIADASIFVDSTTGNNIALSIDDFLNMYGIKDTNGNYLKTATGNWLTQGVPAGITVMDGWSAYMNFSTRPIPLKTLISSSGYRMAVRGDMQRLR